MLRFVGGMRKKIILLINCILLLGCLGFLRMLGERAISCPVASEHELLALQEAKQVTGENILTDLRFNQVSLVQDVEAGIFYLPLDMEEERWEAGELTSGQPDVSLLFSESIDKLDKQTMIREGKAVEFWAVRGDAYRKYSLVFTGLPIISIETTEHADVEVFGGTIRFWEAQSKQNWAYSNILEAHIRGNTSRIYPKKGYKLALKKQDKDGNVVEDKRSVFGLRQDDEYILNAMYTDSSKIRDALCADIWSGIGAESEAYPDVYLGTRMTYAEVFFNGTYWGLYALMEPIDSRQLDLGKEQKLEIVEYSYKSSYPQTVPTEELLKTDMWLEEMAGYKLKGTYVEISKEQWEPLLRYLTWKESEDEAFLAQASQVVDTDNMMEIWVYLQAVLGIDNRAKNMFYVAKYTEGDYRMYLAPWDMDLSMGDTLMEATEDYPWSVGLNPMIYRERINFEPGDRMIALNADQARERVARIWEQARKTVLSDAYLQNRMEALSHLVQDSGAAARDADRWPDSMQGADYEKLKLLTCYRMELLDRYFYDNLEAYLELGYS